MRRAEAEGNLPCPRTVSRKQIHSTEHVPAHRLSNDARTDLLFAMVIRFSGFSAETIVRCYLNKRGRTPPADEGHLRCAVSYPEPGVMRCYCGTDTIAWSDQVNRKEVFRLGTSAA
jgi:hypothetical protein